MRPADQHRLRRADETGIDVGLAERHVGAVLAIEDQRKGVLAFDREEDERGQSLLVDAHAGRDHALAAELLEDETAHLLVADPGDDGRAQAETGGADGDVGRRAADGLGKGGDVFQAGADLLAVEIDGGAADGDDVEGGFHSVTSCQ